MDNDGVQPDFYAKAFINDHTAPMLWPIALMLIDLYFTQTAFSFHQPLPDPATVVRLLF